ncbi:MAG: hypothetical protein N0E59_02180 [Candidatus Thiodiazotropha taylori]|nr:hypothetical protein [Candidatus Thiodiazotropha taylori]MCG8051914.1 hypothetical protein [Candidatus Thiodiazotropha taylori]MCG8108686.1 hypothetical protein [Candidatus Thiodiazotropha taylori]MCG8109550.1 hypothetical protein [Candidatus Thiodiazotropha taylori]MCW4281022.1 hypothetical protein [Candidatus Thiodiazotropha taylori]
MTNKFVTNQQISTRGIRLLHAKLPFTRSCTDTYARYFGRPGDKIGHELDIRLPNQVLVREGPVHQPQPLLERVTTIPIQTQMGIDLYLTMEELALSADGFTRRFLQPAMNKLAAAIEFIVMERLSRGVALKHVLSPGRVLEFEDLLMAKRHLDFHLAPKSNRRGVFSIHHQRELGNMLQRLYNPRKDLSDDYRNRQLHRVSGFEFVPSTVVPPFESGLIDEAMQLAEAPAYDETDHLANVRQLKLKVASRNHGLKRPALARGDFITIDGVMNVHPEVKQVMHEEKPLVVTDSRYDSEGHQALTETMTVTIDPPLVFNGPYQNASGELKAETLVKKTLRKAAHETSLLYHPDAFVATFVPLPVPKGVAHASRTTKDGISMRMVRDYIPKSDLIACRFDVLFGCKVLRPELAVRLLSPHAKDSQATVWRAQIEEEAAGALEQGGGAKSKSKKKRSPNRGAQRKPSQTGEQGQLNGLEPKDDLVTGTPTESKA